MQQTLEGFKNYLQAGSVNWDYYLSTDPVIYMNGEREQQLLEDVARSIGEEAVKELAKMRVNKWKLNTKGEQ